MATQNVWKSYGFAINYACTSFGTGVPLPDILQFLRSNGYPELERATIEGWLRAERRRADLRSATSRPAQIIGSNDPNTQPAPANHQTASYQPTGSKYSNTLLAPATTGSDDPNTLPAPANYQTAHHQPTSSSSRSTSVNPRTRQDPEEVRLNAQADSLAIQGHRAGHDIGKIRDDISFHGHKASLNAVIMSLWRQGVTRFNVSRRMR